jgi:hypothetical protein
VAGTATVRYFGGAKVAAGPKSELGAVRGGAHRRRQAGPDLLRPLLTTRINSLMMPGEHDAVCGTPAAANQAAFGGWRSALVAVLRVRSADVTGMAASARRPNGRSSPAYWPA